MYLIKSGHFVIMFTVLIFLELIPTLISSTVIDSKIRKCSCGTNKALQQDGQCIDNVNPVPVWDEAQQVDYLVNITDFRELEVKALECTDGFSKLNLSLSQFLIYTNGLLNNLELVSGPLTEEYCIEHVLLDDGLTLVAEVCQMNPKIHFCCPENHISREGNCVFSENIYNPPRLVGFFHWENYTTESGRIECGENHVIKKKTVSLPYDVGAALIGYPLGSRLLWNSLYHFQPMYFNFEEYCISIEEYDSFNPYVAEFCILDPKLEFEQICENRTCVQKCCPDGFVYDRVNSICVPYNYTLNWNDTFLNSQIPDNFRNYFGLPLCLDFHVLTSSDTTEESMLPIKPTINFMGHLLEGAIRRFPTDYCIGGFIDGYTDDPQTLYESALVCFLESQSACSWRWIAGSVLMGISCLFYVLTIFVYVTIADLRNRMSGKCLISEVSCLLTSYIILIFLQNSDNYSGPFCNIPGTIGHMTILGSFFWLNVMCYDMWITLTSIRLAANTRGNPNKRFFRYCLYAWGMPVFISGIRVLIDEVVPVWDNDWWLVRTTLGKTHCFFSSSDPMSKWVYLYIPIAIILVLNTLFFTMVAVGVLRTKNKTAKLMRETKRVTNIHDTKNAYLRQLEKTKLYLKLFLVMGISWVMEIIMWVAVPENDCHFWILDTINMFQGVFIFIIFVCKKSTINKVKAKFLPNYTPSMPPTPATIVASRARAANQNKQNTTRSTSKSTEQTRL